MSAGPVYVVGAVALSSTGHWAGACVCALLAGAVALYAGVERGMAYRDAMRAARPAPSRRLRARTVVLAALLFLGLLVALASVIAEHGPAAAVIPMGRDIS